MTAFVIFLIAVVVSAKFRKFVFTALALLLCLLWYGGETLRESNEAARQQRIRDREAGRPHMRPYEDQFVAPALPGQAQESVPRLHYDDGYSYYPPQQWPREAQSPPLQVEPVDIFADPPAEPDPAVNYDEPFEYTDGTPNTYRGDKSWPGSSWTDPSQGGGNPYANGR